MCCHWLTYVKFAHQINTKRPTRYVCRHKTTTKTKHTRSRCSSSNNRSKNTCFMILAQCTFHAFIVINAVLTLAAFTWRDGAAAIMSKAVVSWELVYIVDASGIAIICAHVPMARWQHDYYWCSGIRVSICVWERRACDDDRAKWKTLARLIRGRNVYTTIPVSASQLQFAIVRHRAMPAVIITAPNATRSRLLIIGEKVRHANKARFVSMGQFELAAYLTPIAID